MFIALNENRLQQLTRDQKTYLENESLRPESSELCSIQNDYNFALRNLASGNNEEAYELLQRLNKADVFQRAKSGLKGGGSLKDTDEKTRRLSNAILKNLAGIAHTQKNDRLATEYYREALDLYSDDVATWYNYGACGFKSDQFTLARFAFEQALELSPDHWLSAERLSVTLFVLGDYSNCLFRLRGVLERNPSHFRSLIIRDEIFNRYSYFQTQYGSLFTQFSPDVIFSEQDRQNLISRLDELSEKLAVDFSQEISLDIYQPENELNCYKWSALAQYLININKELIDKNKTLVTPVSLSSQPNSAENATAVMDCQNDLFDANSTLDISVSSSEMQSESDHVSSTHHKKRHKRKLHKKSDSSPRGSTGSGPDMPDNKRRSTRLIPGFFMEDPEAFGPLTTRPINLKDQLYSYVPTCLKNISAHKCANMERHHRDQSKISFVQLLDENQVEISNFLLENNGKSYAAIVDRFLTSFTAYKFISEKWPEGLRAHFLALHRIWKSFRHMDAYDVAQSVVYLTSLELEFEFGCGADEIEFQGVNCYLAHFLRQCVSETSSFNADFCRFACRFYWLQAKICERRQKFDAAIRWLHSCMKCFVELFQHQDSPTDNESSAIFLANSGDKIDKATLEEKIDFMTRSLAFLKAEVALEEGQYEFVIDNVLLPTGLLEKPHSLEKCKGLFIVCNAYANRENYVEMSLVVADLLASQVKAYHSANFKEVADHFEKFSTILHWIFLCYEKDKFFLEMSDTDVEHNRRLKMLIDALIDIILILIDFNDNNAALAEKFLPPSSWFESFELLYEICKRAESRSFDLHYAKNWWSSRRSDVVTGYNFVLLATRSLMILNVAHEELGKRRLCTKDGGRLLIKFVEELMLILRLPIVADNFPSSVNDDTLNCAEQCFYCLYNYPRKRSRCIIEHEAQSVELKWLDLALLFDFVRPERSPEFDDNPHGNLSSETVHLLHRIENLIPEHLRPDQHLSELERYIQGRVQGFIADAIYTSNEQSSASDHRCLPIVWDLYHLVADYYGKLKEKDLHKVCRYYQLDLCINPDRGDSWAGLALHRAALVEKMLSSLELKYMEDDIRKIATNCQSTLFCFDKALSFLPNHVVLLVEEGSLAYNVHAFISRSLKRRSTSRLQHRSIVEELKSGFLSAARKSLEQALKIIESHSIDEYRKDAWIVHYLLGKLYEKTSETFLPGVFLPHYHRAAHYLHTEGARYPLRIPYTPPRFAYEALEVFYRIYASVLKWMSRVDKLEITAEIREQIGVILRYFKLFSDFPLRKSQRTSDARMNNRAMLSSNPDAIDCIEYVLNRVTAETNGQDVRELNTLHNNSLLEVSNVAEAKRKIITDIVEVLRILGPKTVHPYYKSYYRLAYLFHYGICDFQDEVGSRRILLGKAVNGPSLLDGCLFQNFRGQHLFEGIWLIPADDISRPGSFAAYLYKSVCLLIDVLQKLGDFERLIELVKFLARKPASLQTQYLKECDRFELAGHAFSTSENVTRRLFDKNANENAQQKICTVAYRFYNHLHSFKLNMHALHWYNHVLTYFYSALCKTSNTVDQSVVLAFYEKSAEPQLRHQQSSRASPIPDQSLDRLRDSGIS